MRRVFLILLIACAFNNLHAQVNIITTICGNDTADYKGDNGLAIKAKLNVPDGIYLKDDSTLIFADAFNHVIRAINLYSNIITTIAGNGTPGYSGDGGTATLAQLFIPEDVYVDKEKNIFLCDAGNNRIRRVDSKTNVISTIAGSGPTGVHAGGDGGDGGLATDALLNNPSSVCVDRAGNIFLSDYYNKKIKKIDAVTSIITTIAGNGTAINGGDNIPATAIGISGGVQIFPDTSDNIIFSDQYNQVVRRIDKITNIVTTIAGNGSAGYSGDDSLATNAQLNLPSGLFIDVSNNLFIVSYTDGTIRKVNSATGIITTFAGAGTRGFAGDGGLATNAQLKCADICVDKYGSMYIADMDNNRIRMVRDTTLHNVGTSPLPSPKEREVRIYPNPAISELTVEGVEGYEVSIYNMLGQSFNKFRMTKNKEIINVASLVPSLYIIELVDPSTGLRMTRRFVKE